MYSPLLRLYHMVSQQDRWHYIKQDFASEHLWQQTTRGPSIPTRISHRLACMRVIVCGTSWPASLPRR
ncbi:hypothetical protein BHE90_017537 [Fusarium euwallaceae]|uniref:Uncharacterized protein n=3 Tax=Fusarium solani species complex TaxID=232080 RepID=A0A428RCB4_9HYPO|nr:hypothetical protein CEP52_017869 [Fusarium oligoseptatum]RSL79728.1 hypothetical protein CDV31_017181 [Fusarium ambrosium]RTE68086.1 hypothetical protein BHE90_017537 [Fusarium euwallaceae]